MTNMGKMRRLKRKQLRRRKRTRKTNRKVNHIEILDQEVGPEAVIIEGVDREAELVIKTRRKREREGIQGVEAGPEINTEKEELTAEADLREGERTSQDQDLEREIKVRKDQ